MTSQAAEVPKFYTDAALEASIPESEALGLVGSARKAQLLLKIRPELRVQAYRDATSLQNAAGGWFSDALGMVINRGEYMPHIR